VAKANAELDHAHQTMDSAQLTLKLAQALIEDFQDGVAVRMQVDDAAAVSLAKIVLGKGGEVPMAITVDPEWDTKPGEVSMLVGGPYDGKSYRIPGADMEDGDMTLQGGHRYKWDGKVFRYVE
jgi:hypothetical protein